INNSLANSPFFQLLGKIAPFIDNIFVFSVYNNTAPLVAPDNPYLYPQTKKGQKELQSMQDSLKK
ncbi:MAG TPA: hypothetical protein VE868_10105, partial [Balneolaceae bacterium]|nr:hypothetical protein [Balneolaceae bacterium]